MTWGVPKKQGPFFGGDYKKDHTVDHSNSAEKQGPFLGVRIISIILLVIAILHDLVYKSPATYGGIVCLGSCRIFTISRSILGSIFWVAVKELRLSYQETILFTIYIYISILW